MALVMDDPGARGVQGAGATGAPRQAVLQRVLAGSTFPQLIVSAIPEAIGPHAVVWAERVASAALLPRAVAQFDRPLNETQTSHSAFWEERVE